jgi:hypothetical protein
MYVHVYTYNMYYILYQYVFYNTYFIMKKSIYGFRESK